MNRDRGARQAGKGSPPAGPAGDGFAERSRRFLALGFRVSFPYNYDPRFWELVRPRRAVIEEVYAGLHPRVFPSARFFPAGASVRGCRERLRGLAVQLARDGIRLNLALNTTPCASAVDKSLLAKSLRELQELVPLRVSVADLYWGLELRRLIPGISLDVSVVAQVQSVYQAMIWRDLLKVDTITVSRNINKDLPRIRSLRRLGLRLKMVVQDHCLPFCPLERYHTACLAAGGARPVSAAVLGDIEALCRYMRHALPVWHWVKKDVLPFHLPRYRGLVDMVKLNDRTESTESNLRTLESYLRMRDDRQVQMGYRESPQTLDRLGRCGHLCASCGFCRERVRVVSPPVCDITARHWRLLQRWFGDAVSPSARAAVAARPRGGGRRKA